MLALYSNTAIDDGFHRMQNSDAKLYLVLSCQ